MWVCLGGGLGGALPRAGATGQPVFLSPPTVTSFLDYWDSPLSPPRETAMTDQGCQPPQGPPSMLPRHLIGSFLLSTELSRFLRFAKTPALLSALVFHREREDSSPRTAAPSWGTVTVCRSLRFFLGLVGSL